MAGGCKVKLGFDGRKSVFGDLQTTKVQLRLHGSGPLLFAYWEVSYLDFLRVKFPEKQMTKVVTGQLRIKLKNMVYFIKQQNKIVSMYL